MTNNAKKLYSFEEIKNCPTDVPEHMYRLGTITRATLDAYILHRHAQGSKHYRCYPGCSLCT